MTITTLFATTSASSLEAFEPGARISLIMDDFQEEIDFILAKTMIGGKRPLKQIIDLHLENKKSEIDQIVSKLKAPKNQTEFPFVSLDFAFDKKSTFSIDEYEKWALAGKGFKRLLELFVEHGQVIDSRPLTNEVKMIVTQRTLPSDQGEFNFTEDIELEAYKLKKEVEEILDTTLINNKVSLREILQLFLDKKVVEIEAIKSQSEKSRLRPTQGEPVESLVIHFENNESFSFGDLRGWSIGGRGFQKYLNLRKGYANTYRREFIKD